jgi:hypothetical protein
MPGSVDDRELWVFKIVRRRRNPIARNAKEVSHAISIGK